MRVDSISSIPSPTKSLFGNFALPVPKLNNPSTIYHLKANLAAKREAGF